MPSLTDIFSSVEVTESDGILILNEFLETNYDRSPTLVAALHAAITELSSPPEPPITRSTTSTSTSTASKSS